MGRKRFVAVAGAVAAVGVAIGWRESKLRAASDRVVPTQGLAPQLIDDVDEERFVTALCEAISFPTVVFDDGTYDAGAFDGLAAMLVQRYPRLHADLRLEKFNEYGLLYTWEGSDPLLDPIVLMAHQDVVPIEEGTAEEWIAPPFEGRVIDGKIYGRGALDCKGPLIAVFEAIEYLLERDFKPLRTVHVVSGHDEEVGGRNGARAIAEELRGRGVTPWFVVDEGGAVVEGVLRSVNMPIAFVGIAEKGFVNFKLTARGEGGHSSLPPQETAVVSLAKAIVALEASPVPARIEAIAPMLDALSDHLPGVVGALAARPVAAASLLSRVFAKDVRMDALQRTTMVPTIIEGGIKANVIPQSAAAVVNVRIIPGDTSSSVLAHIRSIVGNDIDVEISSDFMWEPSKLSRVDSDAWETLRGVIDEVFPSVIIAPWVVTGATDSRFFEELSGDVYRFLPFVLDEAGLSGFHGTNEFVSRDDAKRAVSFFIRLIEVAAGQDPVPSDLETPIGSHGHSE